MSEDSISSNISTMDFEDALAALEEIVRQLESGQIRLEEAVSAYERGIKLKRYCETKLKEAKLTVEHITLDSENQSDTSSTVVRSEQPT